MVTLRLIKEVVEHYHPLFLDAKETTNVTNKQRVSTQFVETHVHVVSMREVKLSITDVFVLANLDSMVTPKWPVWHWVANRTANVRKHMPAEAETVPRFVDPMACPVVATLTAPALPISLFAPVPWGWMVTPM